LQAAVLKAPGCLELENIQPPRCPPGGLLVKTKVCSICPTDVKMFFGGHRDLIYPRIPGHEIAGVVVKSKSDLFKSGARVQIAPGISCGKCALCLHKADNQCVSIDIIGFTYDGGFAEFIAVPPQSLVTGAVNLVPDRLSFEEAALTEPLACCINGQERTGVDENDTVLVIGGGPVGCLHVLLARARGAKKIFLTECLPNRINLAGRFLTDVSLINPLAKEIKKVIYQETKERGVDVILLACREGIDYPLLDLLAPRGRICLFSGLPPEKARPYFDLNTLHYREITLVGAYGCTAAQNKAALELIASGKVPVSWLITRQIRLEQINEGLRYCAQRKGFKVLIKF